MFDPRWDDSRDRDDDARERAYESRDQSGDPRDAFLRDLDLPLGHERELVLDRDRVYELDGDESRTLATVGAFRVVPEHDLLDTRDGPNGSDDALDHLREQGLIQTVSWSEHSQAVVLSERGLDLLEANRRDRTGDDQQAFLAGVSKPRELHHDAHLYAAYRQTETRIREGHDHADVRRVILEEGRPSRSAATR